ncbi:MerR family transcriptional regulator [Galactobacter sp.]|uniref:MerR family transcriptional regulator n=1 Tax=Galactobacter sp. TaxID=2676125 RepID=UPI0025BBD372|nr:MerR family transcriptional regulator [Galactobacter sp.]
MNDSETNGLRVGEAARALGVSVRTLHHWDETGLVSPEARTGSGYRLYSRADIARLQQVLVYREVGMPLEQISRVLASPGADEAEHLRRQRDLLLTRIARLEEMVSSVDTLLERNMTHNELTPEEQAGALGSVWTDPYHDEADMEEAKRALEDLETALAEGLRAGVEPGSSEANALAERHRANVGQWFDVSHARQSLIAQGYTADPRWTEHYDSREPGLAAWLRAIIDANARAHGVDPDTAEWD